MYRSRVHSDHKSMDREKKSSMLIAFTNSKLYLDLQCIIRENALPFLPAKSLFRCQGVCREWKLRISTPFFAHSQSFSLNEVSGLFCQTLGKPPSLISVNPKVCGVPDPTLKFLPVPVDIRSSSNGLLCCQGRTGDKTYYICNPVTKQWKSLPKSNVDHGPDPVVVLVFEPSLLNFVAEYKLLCAYPSQDFEGATEFEIFSSKEGSWRLSKEICFATKGLIPSTGFHLNGTVYWLAAKGSIAAYDLMNDRYRLIQGCYSSIYSSLGTMNGKLCLAHPINASVDVRVLSNIHSNTMQMGSNSKTWSNKKTINLNLNALGLTRHHCEHKVHFINEDVVLGQIGGVMYSYDMKKQETNLMSGSSDHDNARVLSYANTLVYL